MPRDRLARASGCAVFLIGIVALCAVFYWAYELFRSDPAALFGGATKDNMPNLQALLSGLMAGIYRVLLLTVMAIVSGMIANRGIKMYLNDRTSEAQK